jgi:hypothetical protein
MPQRDESVYVVEPDTSCEKWFKSGGIRIDILGSYECYKPVQATSCKSISQFWLINEFVKWIVPFL